MRRRGTRAVFWSLVTLSVAALMLHAACVPFYAGGPIGRAGSPMAWRLEHGRMTVRYFSGGLRETFFVANNTEALRWGDEWSGGGGSWSGTVPLWWVWGSGGALAAGLWWRGRRTAADGARE